MKQFLRRSALSTSFLFAAVAAVAQQPAIQYFRSYSQKGLNVFETTKADTVPFEGIKVRVGGNFTQDFQSLAHQNNADSLMVNGVNTNQLISLTSGFNLAMANLNIDVQLADGIRMNLTTYLSSRHHPEAWVKGGYIQFDKLVFLKSKLADRIMKNVTLKVGHFELDYGDQHFRRTDGGNSMHNPFVENYIMDAFTTEIGGEIYFHPQSGFIAMAGITNGQLNPTVVASSKIDSATGKLNKNAPAFHGKLGYDKQLTEDFRLRLTGSFYAISSTGSNTLFSGDRTGSHYFMVMENTLATTEANFRSGRYTPGFSQQVTTFSFSPFIKFKGLELFGTYEMAQGRNITEKNLRAATQYAADLIYRFPAKNENFWIGASYNSLTATLPSNSQDISINRTGISAGWFVTRNILMKAAYVSQEYKNFVATDIRSGGKFNGLMIEAAVGF